MTHQDRKSDELQVKSYPQVHLPVYAVGHLDFSINRCTYLSYDPKPLEPIHMNHKSHRATKHKFKKGMNIWMENHMKKICLIINLSLYPTTRTYKFFSLKLPKIQISKN